MISWLGNGTPFVIIKNMDLFVCSYHKVYIGKIQLLSTLIGRLPHLLLLLLSLLFSRFLSSYFFAAFFPFHALFAPTDQKRRRDKSKRPTAFLRKTDHRHLNLCGLGQVTIVNLSVKTIVRWLKSLKRRFFFGWKRRMTLSSKIIFW